MRDRSMHVIKRAFKRSLRRYTTSLPTSLLGTLQKIQASLQDAPTPSQKGPVLDSILSQKINLLILHLRARERGVRYPIRIGVIPARPPPEGQRSRNLLTALLGDPLGGDQKWYYEFRERSEKGNNLVVYYRSTHGSEDTYRHTSSVFYNRSLSVWEVPAPLLKTLVRKQNFRNLYSVYNKGKEGADDIVLNDLEFLELRSKEEPGNCNLLPLAREHEDDEILIYKRHNPLEAFDDTDAQLDIGDGCHMYIYHTSDPVSHVEYGIWPHAMVVDVEKCREAEKESLELPLPPRYFFDLEAAKAANETLMADLGATKKYMLLVEELQLLKIVYSLNTITSGDIAINRLLKLIHSLLAVRFLGDSGAVIEKSNISAKRQQVGLAIETWAKDANLFLQNNFVRSLELYERANLGWWRLVWISDDLEYYLAEMVRWSLRGNPSFLTLASYVEGRIDSYLGAEEGRPGVSKSTDSFVERLRPKINSTQEAITSVLMTNIYGVQAPATAIAFFGGYCLYGFDLYAVGGVIALSTAIVCNNISKTWFKAISAFKREAKEELRTEISEEKRLLERKWTHVMGEREHELDERAVLVEQLRVAIENECSRKE